MEVLAGMAGQYGIFAATYGIAGVHLSQPHTQVVIIGNEELAEKPVRSGRSIVFRIGKAVIQLDAQQSSPAKPSDQPWLRPFLS